MSTRHPIAIAFPLARSLTFSLLIGGALLSVPPTAARADSLAPQQQLADTKSQAAKDATGIKPETVEQRIANLHASLKITPAEESKWDAVAQVMRDNAATIDKLVSAKKLTQAEQKMRRSMTS